MYGLTLVLFGSTTSKFAYSVPRAVCNACPAVDFFWAPLTPRLVPVWFQTSQHIVLKLIEEEASDQQTRIMTLPRFTSDPSSLDPDGIHFLPAPGMKYVMHLIDSARYAYVSCSTHLV